MTAKNNILFIHCDSMDGRAMGCMGHPAMRRATPNIDRLAAGGVLFRNAYSNNPICCPSRAAMFSGRFTHHCEAWNNHKGLSENEPTFLDALSGAGYHNTVLGKTDYLSGHHSVSARVSSWLRSSGIRRPMQRIRAPEVLENHDRRIALKDWCKVDQAVECLSQTSSSPEPFFLYLGLSQPHHPFRSNRRYLDMIDENGVTVPPPDEDPHPVMEHQKTVKGWRHGYTDDMIRSIRRVYFAMIAEVDTMVGDVLDALDRSGRRDNTTVIFSSDHGELAMEHRQLTKMSLYEPSVRVPLLVAGPGWPAGTTRDALVSLVDIYPTLADLAGAACPPNLDGWSLLPSATGRSDPRPDWVFSEVHTSSCLTGGFMLRQGPWKYVAYPGFAPQLFNLNDDPYEIRNLTAKHPDMANTMDTRLRAIVDYEAVDARVKAYDRDCFRQWRAEHVAAGDYHRLMGDIFSDNQAWNNEKATPWSDRDEETVNAWLGC